MAIREGSGALGLSIEWNFEFVGAGTTQAPTRNVVFLDVGGSLQPGVLDQHQDGALGRSTADLVILHPELVYGHLIGPWVERRDNGQAVAGTKISLRIATHVAPDFDAIVSAWLVMKLVEDGELPRQAQALALYVSRVDQGRFEVKITQQQTATHPVHMAVLALQHLQCPAGERRHEWVMKRGLALLEKVMDGFRATVIEGPELNQWRSVPEFQDIVELLDTDLRRSREDLCAGEAREVELPCEQGSQTIRTKTWIASSPPKAILAKYWLRAEGYVFTILPLGPPAVSDGATRYSRVILSLNPNWVDPTTGLRPTLLGLGYALERAETEFRTRMKGEDDRLQVPRWDDGSCTNADPWYDGRGHGYTIIDSPTDSSGGTVLPYEQVVRVSTQAFWRLHVEQMEICVVRALPNGDCWNDASGVTGLVSDFSSDTRQSPELGPWYTDGLVGGPAGTTSLSLRPWISLTKRTLRQHPLRNPDSASPTFEVLEVLVDKGVPLDDVGEWVRCVEQSAGGHVYLMVQARIDPAGRTDAQLTRALEELCFGTLVTVDVGVGPSRLLLNRSTIAVQGNSNASAPITQDPKLRDLLEVLLYVAYQVEMLSLLSNGIVNAASSGSRIVGGRALRSTFLLMQARHVHPEPYRNPLLSEVFHGIESQLGLNELRTKVQGEVEVLEQLERDESARITDLVLSIVAIGGIVQSIAIDWSGLNAAQLALIPTIVAVLTLIVWRQWTKTGSLLPAHNQAQTSARVHTNEGK